jgi:CHAT domain-containing protein/tetratricopeptide (TPR) repeat protein
VIGRRAPAIALAFAIAIAGCGGNAPVDEMPGATWARVHATIDSLGAQDQVEAALQVVAAARALPHPPDWLAADLAANEASLQRRAALPAPARAVARAVDERVLRVPELLEHDSLTVAQQLAREVVDARSRTYPPGHPMLGRSCMQLAEVAFHMGRGGEADSLARQVLAHLSVGPDSLHPLAADAEQMVGRVIKNFSGARFRDDVMRHYQRALRIRERIDGPQSLTVAAIHHDLGNLERAAKRPDDAIAHFRHALEIRRAILGPHDEEVASTLSAIAWLSASRGDWPGVERDMREALVAVPESALTAPSVLALRTGLLGQALRRMGRTREAIVSLRTAVAAVETMWVRVPHDGEGSVQAGLSIHRELALALAAEGQAEEAFEHVERSQLRLWVPDAPAGGWANVLPRVQCALPDDAALVLWPRTALFPPGGDYPMWACVVRRTGRPAWVRIDRTSGWPSRGTPPREALNRELAHAAQWPMRVSDTRAIDSLAAVMGTELLTPIEPLLRGVSRLVVSGPDLMAWTPLSMLRDANGVRLMDRFVISYVPSALAYADLSERTTAVPAARSERALLVGAPEPGRDDAIRWPPLTGAADELSGLSRLFPEATVLTGSDATAGRLDAMAHNGALDRYGIVHLAAHIDLNPARVLQSAFVLAPDRPGDPHGSRLTAARIAGQWHVHAGLVSLAGCYSAIGLYSASEGWLGMYSAFLAAGAPCLLVSLWPVDDEATRRLMIEFHTRLLAQTGTRDPAQALRAAQRAVREYRADDGTKPFAHPVYWAGFAVVGRG